ncbi:MAG: response regulator [Bryobacteraceae bacterium]
MKSRTALRNPIQQILKATDKLLGQGGAGEQREEVRAIEAAAHDLLAVLDRDSAVDPMPVRAGSAEEGAPRSKEALGFRILVVDDNAVNRDILRRRLERQGHAVNEAADGRQAIAMARADSFDLMLLDIMMPVMDGFAVLDEIRGDPGLCEMAVIVVSAMDELQNAVRCLEMGAEDYLFKPVDPVLLRARIGTALEKRRLRTVDRKRTAELEEALHRLKHTQDQLVAHEKLASLGTLTAGVAHEIQNPLNFVVNFAEISVAAASELRMKLEGAAGADQEIRDLASDLELNARKIREHGARADSIIRDMLMHSRTGAGERRPTDVNGLLEEFVKLAWHGMRARNPGFTAKTHCDLDPKIGLVEVVPQDLSRVFLNVASNAFYAVAQQAGSEPGFDPTVWFSTHDCGDGIEVRIRDNGPGIPGNIRDRIFEPFFTTKPAGEGTGLGLSLSYEIVVKEHKGEIRVESQPGHGTEFIIAIPKRTEPEHER